MVMGREPAVRPHRGRYPCGFCSKGVGANSLWCQCCERKCHQRCLGFRNLRRAGDNFRCPTWVRGVVVVPRRSEVEEDSLEIVDSFCYLGNVVSCGARVASAVSDRISGAWSKWRELESLLVNHSIPLDVRAKVYCVHVWGLHCCMLLKLGTNRKTGRTAS